jgi:endoglucanase
MRFAKYNDKRLRQQIIAVGILTILPIATVSLNGIAAVRALFASDVSPSTRVEADRGVDSRPTDSNMALDLTFGVYDPAGAFSDDRDFGIRHEYVSWIAFDPAKLSRTVQEFNRKQAQLFLTVEPWPVEGRTKTLLSDVVDGLYDVQIDRLATALEQSKGPVYISWGHEMDQDLASRYPWSGAPSKQYVAAYRHVVDRMRSAKTAELRWIWEGVLKQGSLRYWPGEEYVDYIGMPIYSYPSWDQQMYGYIRDFPTTFNEKRALVQQFGKPLIITELGVCGSDDFRNFWMRSAILSLPEYRDLAAVVFFYSADAEGVWGKNVATPDWRVHPDLVRGLVAWQLHH